MQRYLRTNKNNATQYPDDDVIPQNHHVVTDDVIMEDDPFLIMVKERVKSWTKAFSQERNEVSETTDIHGHLEM